ncbi:glycosyltransferase family 4 protein [Paenibacillus sepulcri]|uniref:Glycosyltransferase family 4 protein n=1 Tax=Paenibacillus sepulcri TaxID=359917 RepID=A0ABS7BVP5_9BACL|nr:glycosyltransferase family 4 protein [Paenibacillus sepulcri]
MKQIVIISPDHIGKQMAGPGIRYWNFAKEMTKEFDVILFTPNLCEINADFQIETLDKKTLANALKKADAVLVQGMTLWEYPIIKKYNIPVIIDLYDPFILENLETFKQNKHEDSLHKVGLSVLIDQLKFGDYFICASEKQKDFWIGMLAAINRVNPVEYHISKDLSSLINVVPFGLDAEMPVHTKSVMKGVVPGINEEDRVILWGGGIWPWLDPLTAVKAMKLLAEKHHNIKLFFMGTKHPNPNISSMKIVDEVMKLSDELQLTNRFVFFNDWADYNDRYNYYLESDIGLSLHYNHLETRYSFRTRMLDYIRCQLPIIGTYGDGFSDLIAQYNIGAVVPPEDEKALAAAIEMILHSDQLNEQYGKLIEDYHWDNCVQPLIQFCKDPVVSNGKSQSLNIKQLSKINYYWTKGKHYLSEGEIKFLVTKIISNLKK